MGEPMGISDIPILAMLRTRLEWAQARQRVLSENVANADTPGFRAQDLTPLKFEDSLLTAPRQVSTVALVRTEDGHMAGMSASGDGQFRPREHPDYSVRPTGNAVNLEQEMMKVAANQMDYQAVTALYARSLSLIKTAIGKR
jgi:flagellar basal-body rod protein FlgB